MYLERLSLSQRVLYQRFHCLTSTDLEAPVDHNVLHRLKTCHLHVDVPPSDVQLADVVGIKPHLLLRKELDHDASKALHELRWCVCPCVQHEAGAKPDIMGGKTKLFLHLRDAQDL